MKQEYVEKLPARKIKHKIITCDNPNCGVVIRDKREFDCCPTCDKPFDVKLEEHWQTSNEDGDGFLDFCSEKCLKKTTKLFPKSNKLKRLLKKEK